jgi:hypothetical protein
VFSLTNTIHTLLTLRSMLANFDSPVKSRFLALRGIRRTCTTCVACLMIGFGFSHTAQAQERGAIGGALSAGLGLLQGDGALTVGASGWYRLIPAFALGVNFGSTNILDGVEQHGTEVVSYTSFEAFGEGRTLPSSPVGVFGRASVGVAHLTLLPPSTGPLYDEERTEPILELEGGPELRLFFAPSTTRARPDLFLRVRGTLTAMSAATFYGLGLALGYEG